MKRLLAALLPVLCVALALPLVGRGEKTKGKKYALLVGVKDYYKHKRLRNLKYTENDVEDLARVLRKKSAGFTEVTVLTTTRGEKAASASPTAANIRAALKRMLGKVGKYDTVLVALSGHGVQLEVKDPKGKKKAKKIGFFCPGDARLTDVEYRTGRSPTMIGLDEIFKQLEDSPARVNLLLVDACRNELILEEGDKGTIDLETIKPASGVAALFSCAKEQKSYESAKLGAKGHGVFFYHVLQGLQGEAKNKKGEVTWDRLVTYVKEEVPAAALKVVGDGAQQSPHLVSNLVNSPVLIGFDSGVALAKRITNSIGMKLVLIPKGTFTMGSPKDEKDRERFGGKETQHEVEITKPFYMGMYTVTQAKYKKVMGENPSYFSASGGGKEKVKGLDTDDFPVEKVSWHDAKKFCDKLSALAREKKAGWKYRLPTEAEWEYACRAGTTTPFHFGKSASSTQANFDGNYPYGGAAKGKYLGRTCKVGSYDPNKWELYDMHGNVWQWCADWYDKDYYKDSPKRDPQGPDSGTRRVLRGGSWSDLARSCRAAYRLDVGPAYRDDNVGFRVVCVPVARTP